MLLEKIKLEDDEKVLLTTRRHWFVFSARIIGNIIAAISPLVILVIAGNVEQTSSIVSAILANYSNQIWFALALWLLFNWMTLAHQWTDHYLDLLLITDRRIILIDQKSLFVRNVGSFRLERLQDMNMEIPGFMATMLNYGNIDAQTASASEGEFRVKGIPDPRQIKAIILEAADNRMKLENGAMRNDHTGGL